MNKDCFQKTGIIFLGVLFLPRKNSQASLIRNDNPEKFASTRDSEYSDLDFKTSPNQFSIVQYHINKEVNEAEFEKLYAYGIGCIQHRMVWNKKYLEDEAAWQKLAENVMKAKNPRFHLNIESNKSPADVRSGSVLKVKFLL